MHANWCLVTPTCDVRCSLNIDAAMIFRTRNIVFSDGYNATITELKNDKNPCTTAEYLKSK